ncbi:T6SS immunity protein Tli4 family protein [Cupriavidus sp. H18C2]|uniref:T6SS immunity protein Tli4 family protein n=1 Tax=Cupriavidus sp. H18C2 TaxID=3241602 RepID=UPI003BF84F6D
MKRGWKTRAIGRHLVDIPESAKTIESYTFYQDKIKPLSEIRGQEEYKQLISERERILRAAEHEQFGSMFVERVEYANGSVTLISWNKPTGEICYEFETYFRAGNRYLSSIGEVSRNFKAAALQTYAELAREWRQTPNGEIPEGIGFVVDDAILAEKRFNPESWRMVIQLHGKPDVSFELTSYARRRVAPRLRERAGGIVAGMLGIVAGFARLRDRARPVGPIQADEILLASTQDGKRGYGFKWEAPGKEYSLAEPNLNASLRVGESAYATNRESFATDEEALELWDAVIGSIRLRPGAA